MATLDAQLEAMRHLAENWDGYSAAPPPAHVVELAHEFVQLVDMVLRKHGAASGTVCVSPTRIGGVLVEWEDADAEHEVEINPDRSLSFLRLNKTTGHIQTRTLAPASHTVVQPEFLHELCQLLAA